MATAEIQDTSWRLSAVSDVDGQAGRTGDGQDGLRPVGHDDCDDHQDGACAHRSRLRPVLDVHHLLSIRCRSGSPESEIARAADAAIQQMLHYDYLQRNGRLNPEVEPTIMDRLGAEVADVIHPRGARSWVSKVLVPGVAAVVLAITAASVFFAEPPAHSVHGVLLAGTQPVVQATIVFRRFKGGEKTIEQQFITGVDGTFYSDPTKKIPSGLYAVVVVSPQVVVGKGPKPATVPAMYRDVTTTPLRVNVTDNLKGLRLSMRR